MNRDIVQLVDVKEWNYGDFYDNSINISNIIAFAEFIKNKKITNRNYLEDNIEKIHEEFGKEYKEEKLNEFNN